MHTEPRTDGLFEAIRSWRALATGIAVLGTAIPLTVALGGPSASGLTTLTLATKASNPVHVGGAVMDTATLSNATAATGTITFSLFGPGNINCAGTAVTTSAKPVAGNGTYPSDPFTTTAPGTYRWTARYSGDGTFGAVTTMCSDANESVLVTKAPVSLTTTASPSVALGGAISDTATIAGGVAPGGTITFTLFGPADPTCTSNPLFTSVKNVTTGNGTYPSAPFTTTVPGTYHWVARYSGDTNNDGAGPSVCGAGKETVVVTKPSPTLGTAASASVLVGGAISDTATLSSASGATGTITFTLFGPDNATCAGTPIATSAKTVTGNGTYPSDPFPTTAPGTYRWIALYSGDGSFRAVSTKCSDAGESVVVTKIMPTLTTVASGSAKVGGTITDTATLSGGVNPTGAITLRLYGPNNATCSGTAITTSLRTVTGNGSYLSDPFTPTAPGTYHWVAAYGGDVNNHAAGPTACSDPAESVVVTKATPTLLTTASPTVQVGGSISDTANLSGGANPTGNITFSLFGPDNANCSGTPIATSMKTVTGNGGYPSDPFTSSATGTYRWIAAYSGDANNAAVTTMCGDAGESVVVAEVVPTLVTSATASVPVGGTTMDTATLSGASSPIGTITFSLFGPNNANCSGTPVTTSTKTVTGNGSYLSGPFTTLATGTFRWIAAYSGDANNGPVATACGDPAETVVVTKATTALSTSASAASIQMGGTSADTANLSGGFQPTGNITFSVFGPDNATCSGNPTATFTKTVAGNGSLLSDPFAPAAPGTYRWIAAYSGDANNAGATTACGDPAEGVVVTKANAAIVTTASASVAVGAPISDVATLSGAASPTGSIVFTLFGPDDATCSGTPIAGSMKTVTGNGNVSSDAFTTLAPGTYRWIAAYSGDVNNAAATTSCGDSGESVVVTKTAPVLATTASDSVRVGEVVSDIASLSGGYNATGTLTFSLFGPDNATCSGSPIATSMKAVAGNGPYASDPFTSSAPGTYQWIATYSGDVNNASATTSCGDPNESVVVTKVIPSLATVASASVLVGGKISDAATLSDGMNPTGNLTIALFGPDNATCAGAPVSTSTKSVTGNATYSSDTFTTSAAGTYRWIASYGGDANNVAVTTACGDESVVVTRPGAAHGAGYWLVASDGGIFTYGDAGFFGSAGALTLKQPVVGIAATPSGKGYWLVASDGGIFTYGDAGFFGSAGALTLKQPVVGIAATPSGKGYWLVASDGGIFTYGDAGFFGSAGALTLKQPVVGIAATPSGKGYWLVASDGGIFTYGDAGFFGSAGALTLKQPVVGIAATPSGKGYWLVASDGGIFTYGDAGFFGSAGALTLKQPVVGIAATPSGKGYWLVASDGGIFTYGDAGFFGSAGALTLKQPVVGIAAD